MQNDLKTAQQHNAEQGIGQYEFHEKPPVPVPDKQQTQTPAAAPIIFENIDPARLKMQVKYLRSGETRVLPIGSSLLYGHLGNRDKEFLYSFTLIVEPEHATD